MPNEFSRNTQDADLSKSIVLPASPGAVTTADIDLGTNSKGFLTENHELEIFVPALNATQLPNGATITVLIQNGPTAGTTVSSGISRVITGAGGVGSAASTFRVRLPANSAQFLNVRFTAATTGSLTAITAAVKLLT